MSRVFEIFSTSYLAIIGAIVLHAGVGFYFLLTEFKTPAYYGINSTEELVEVDLDDIDPNKDQSVQAAAEAENNLSPEDVKALSSDADDSREVSNTDYSQYTQASPRTAMSAEESVQNMLDEIKGELNGKDYNTDLGEEKNYDFNKLDGEQSGGGDGKQKKAGKTMADYQFEGTKRLPRNTRGLKIPGYTGKGSGVIYVKVQIDPIGYVIGNPTIDYIRTTITEPYAIQEAIRYAKKERFVRDPKAPKKQNGYFIYTYIGQ